MTKMWISSGLPPPGKDGNLLPSGDSPEELARWQKKKDAASDTCKPLTDTCKPPSTESAKKQEVVSSVPILDDEEKKKKKKQEEKTEKKKQKKKGKKAKEEEEEEKRKKKKKKNAASQQKSEKAKKPLSEEEITRAQFLQDYLRLKERYKEEDLLPLEQLEKMRQILDKREALRKSGTKGQEMADAGQAQLDLIQELRREGVDIDKFVRTAGIKLPEPVKSCETSQLEQQKCPLTPPS